MSQKYKHAPVQPGTKSKVQQNLRASTDLNQVMQRHLTGPNRFGPVGNPNATRQPRFLDLASGESYHDMLNRVTQINTMFGRLPARVRTRFQNRPELLLTFVADPANSKEAVKLGLIDDPEVIQAVIAAEQAADKEAQEAGQEAAPRADSEAQPSYTPQKGVNPPAGG